MQLLNCPVSSGSGVIADWIEFRVLASEFGVVRINDLVDGWDFLKNDEGSDPEGGDTSAEQFTDLVLNVLNSRLTAVGESYPFCFSETGDEFMLKAEVTAGGYAYLLCLMLAHPKDGEIFRDVKPIEKNDTARHLFQVCATISAAGAVGGSAYSFGFPRPESRKFLDALREAYELFGEGAVVEKIPATGPAQPKDDDVDVIAWKVRRDGMPGKQYLLGQVASGFNWSEKTIKAAIELFHKTWFNNPLPASVPTPAMFIPFCLAPRAGQTEKDLMYYYTNKFGNFYYRDVIPSLVEEGLASAEVPGNYVGRVNELNDVARWVEERIDYFKESNAV